MNINTTDLNIIKFGDNDVELEIMIHVRLVDSCNECKQRKAFKKEISKELMLLAWHH